MNRKLQPLFVLALVLLAAGCEPRPDTQMVVMRDGVQLATDCFISPNRPSGPVILIRTVYGRSQREYRSLARNIFAAGLALVVQDTRGRFDSQGEDRVFLDDAWGALQDGADTVAWLRAQPWCNGKVGTYGGSALGITQILMAPATQDIAGQSISVACSSLYNVAYIGGVWNKALAEDWTESQGNDYMLETWRQHPRYDSFWEQLDAEAQAGRVTAPAIHYGGWWDIFQQGTINNFTSRQHSGGAGAKGSQFLVMGPWPHGKAQETGDLILPDNFDFPETDLESLLWTYWLMGTGPEVMNRPRVYYYVLGDVDDETAPGNTWRSAEGWPPLETEAVHLYLGPSHALSTDMPAQSGVYTFTYDPENPCPTRGGANLSLPAGPYDQREVRARADVVSFATEPLHAPFEATGRISVRLFVKTTASDTDFTAKLVDIYPDGREILLVDGIQRLKYRSGNAAADPVAPGQEYELTIDLWSFSIIFNTGHRIGLQLSSSNYPRFEINPNNGDDFPGAAASVTAGNTIMTGPDYPSALILPKPKD